MTEQLLLAFEHRVAFGLEEKLVSLRIRELHDLVLDRRTVAGTARADRTAIHRGSGQAG